MPRIKQSPSKTPTSSAGGPAFIAASKNLNTKKKPRKISLPSEHQSEGGGDGSTPLGAAGAAAVVPVGGKLRKKVVVHLKGKRRYKSGTVAIREIRKYAKSTNLLFPGAPFSRLVREITSDIKADARYTSQGMLALHEAAEQYITEKFIKADLARRHAKRKTLHIDDLLFTPYMTHIVSEVIGNKLAS